ncbi:MAG: hypothetical protein MHM6MM_007744 [Cercozoa sp. M6MM]
MPEKSDKQVLEEEQYQGALRSMISARYYPDAERLRRKERHLWRHGDAMGDRTLSRFAQQVSVAPDLRSEAPTRRRFNVDARGMPTPTTRVELGLANVAATSEGEENGQGVASDAGTRTADQTDLTVSERDLSVHKKRAKSLAELSVDSFQKHFISEDDAAVAKDFARQRVQHQMMFSWKRDHEQRAEKQLLQIEAAKHSGRDAQKRLGLPELHGRDTDRDERQMPLMLEHKKNQRHLLTSELEQSQLKILDNEPQILPDNTRFPDMGARIGLRPRARRQAPGPTADQDRYVALPAALQEEERRRQLLRQGASAETIEQILNAEKEKRKTEEQQIETLHSEERQFRMKERPRNERILLRLTADAARRKQEQSQRQQQQRTGAMGLTPAAHRLLAAATPALRTSSRMRRGYASTPAFRTPGATAQRVRRTVRKKPRK